MGERGDEKGELRGDLMNTRRERKEKKLEIMEEGLSYTEK